MQFSKSAIPQPSRTAGSGSAVRHPINKARNRIAIMIELEKCALNNDRSMEKELVLNKEGDNGDISSQPTLFVLTPLFAAGWRRQIAWTPTT